MTLCLIVSLTILYNKKLRDIHPSLLIGLLGACEFITCYSLYIYRIGTIKYICYWGLPTMFRLSLNWPRNSVNASANQINKWLNITNSNNELWPLVTES